MTLNEMRDAIHQNAVEHGWWDEPRSFGEIIALCHSELSEALEEDRARKPMMYCKEYDEDCGCKDCVTCHDECVYSNLKTEGIATEMADCIIRILDWCGHEGIDIEAVIKAKHEYNKTRPHKHGKAY